MFIRFHYWLMGFVLVIFLSVATGYYYLSLSDRSIDTQLEDTIDYNLKERGYGGVYLNRTTVITFWFRQQGAHDPVSLMFGNGLGSSNASGHIAKRYPGSGIGLTAASTLLWEMGLFGFGLFIAILVFAWRCALRLQRESTVPLVRADARAIQASLALFVFLIFYRVSLLELPSIQIVFATILGYLAWLYRRHVELVGGGS